MNIGEVISALALCASSWDDNADHLLMLKSVFEIEVGEDYIEIHFVDGNTQDLRIDKTGRKC